MDLIQEIASAIRGTNVQHGDRVVNIGGAKSVEMARVVTRVMVKWIREQDETTFCPDEGDEYDCFLVPSRLLNLLEE